MQEDDHRRCQTGVLGAGGISQSDVAHIVLEVNHEHQRDVDDAEEHPERQANEVHATRALFAPQEFHKPWKARLDCRRLGESSEDLEWSQEKDHTGIRQLL